MPHSLRPFRRNTLSILGLAGLVFAFTATLAHAATCLVNLNTDDPGDGSTTGASATVTTLTVSGTLRDCILAANLMTGSTGAPTTPGMAITFDPTIYTGGSNNLIQLGSALPLLFNNTSIDASALSAPVHIHGGGSYRIFFVSGLPDSTQNFNGSGLPDPDGAQPISVSLNNLVLEDGRANGGGGGGGGLGAGGALFINHFANVTLSNVSFTFNNAQGGNGGSSSAGSGMGGSPGGSSSAGGGLSGNGNQGGGGGIGTNASFVGGGSFGGNGIGQLSNVQGFSTGFGGGSFGNLVAGGRGGIGGGGGSNNSGGGNGTGAAGFGGFGGGGGYSYNGGGSGGFGGGGGDTLAGFSRGGDGGFGGGGGCNNNSSGSLGGGFGGFGGGGGCSAGINGGGFGGPGGGFGGAGDPSVAGGGGAAFGGAVFVRDHANLTVQYTRNSGGIVNSGLYNGMGYQNGAAAGSGMFLMANSNTTFDIAGTFTIRDTLADDSLQSLPGTSPPSYGQGFGPGAGIIKQGAGTLILSGDNTHTATEIAAGTLAGNCSVSLSGRVQLDSGGQIAPGDPAVNGGVGTLIGGPLTWNGGGAMAFQLGATTSDQLLIDGPLFKGSAGSFTFHFSIGNGPPRVGNSYTLIQSTDASAFTAADFSYDHDGSYVSLTGSFSITNNAVQFEVDSVTPDRIFANGFD